MIEGALDPICWGFRPHKPAQVYWLYNELFLRSALTRTKPSLFHATDFNGVPTNSRIPVVTTLFDLTPLTLGGDTQGLSNRLSGWRWKTYYFRKLPYVDHIIAISEHAKSEACKILSIDPGQITVIPLGVDHQRYTPEAKGQGAYTSYPPYFLYVGGSDANKNLRRLIDAFQFIKEQWKDVQLVLAGKWSPGATQEFETVIQEKQLASRVRLLGFVPTADLPSLYANALAFVFPSLSEGFGLPVVEAMAAGLPVIASDIEILREVAGDAAILVNPTDTEAWAHALQSVLSSAQVANHYRLVGLQRAKLFHWHRVAQKTWTVYNQVLGQ